MKKFFFAIASLMFFTGTAAAQGFGFGCVQNSIGTVVCAPPHGGIAINSIGTPECGPGQCVRIGSVYCSSVQGGGAGVDSIGSPKCVGGCIRGTSSQCVRPSN